MTEVIRNMRLDGNPFKDDSPTEVKLKTLQEIEDCNFEAGCSYGMAFEVIKEEAIKWVKQMEIDVSDISKKILLKPINNREYWVFTEYRQRWLDFFDISEDDLK